MTVIIDYGMGNLASVRNAFLKVGDSSAIISSDPAMIESAERLVLPGVGAFGDAMGNLTRMNLSAPIRDYILSGKPFLGICLGMQLLFEAGHESGDFEGLGIFKGEVNRFNISLPVPHMGWNESVLRSDCPLFDGLDKKAYFYYDHSFYASPSNPSDCIASCEYGIEFTAAVGKGKTFGVQFHPEKSHEKGLQIIRNFSQMR